MKLLTDNYGIDYLGGILTGEYGRLDTTFGHTPRSPHPPVICIPKAKTVQA
jgi:hypothetical protein